MRLTSRRARTALLSGALGAAILLSSCADGSRDGGTTDPPGPSFVFVTSDPIGQNGFFTSGKAGIEAVAQTFEGTAKTLESSDATTRRANVEAAIAEAPEVVVMLGAAFAEVARELAEQNPHQRFLLIDTTVDGAPENLYQATFREHEVAYLLGVEAGRLSRAERVGSILAVDSPQLQRYALGFAAGAQSVAPKIVVVPTTTLDESAHPYTDPEFGAARAAEFAGTGADQLFAVAARSNEGIFEAAESLDLNVYGVDENQCDLAPGRVVDGTIKAVDTAIETVVGQIMAGKSSSEATVSFGLAEDAMTLVSLTERAADSGCTVLTHPEIVAEVSGLRDDIVDGTLKLAVPGVSGATGIAPGATS